MKLSAIAVLMLMMGCRDKCFIDNSVGAVRYYKISNGEFCGGYIQSAPYWVAANNSERFYYDEFRTESEARAFVEKTCIQEPSK